MKKIILLTALSVFVVFTASFAMSKKKKEQRKYPLTGTIVNYPKGSTNFVIVPDNEPNKKLLALNMGDQFRKEGLKIEFIGVESANQQPIKTNLTPYKLKMIQEKN